MFYWVFLHLWGFPDSSVGKESACNAGDPSSIPGWGRSTGEGIGYPLPYFGASLVGHLVKNPPAMRETWVWSLSWENPLEESMAAHCSILARIPWKEEPDGLQPIGSQRIGHEWVTKHSRAHLIFTIITYKRESIILTISICLQCRRQAFNLWVKKIPWRRKR